MIRFAHCIHGNNVWINCTLCRSGRQSLEVLRRAAQRKIEWPSYQEKDTLREDPLVYTSIDDAFTNIFQSLSNTSKQCKRYYRSCAPSSINHDDQHHCNRFHNPAFTKLQHKNPLQTAEDIHLVVHPGTYAVSAGEFGSVQQQTHVVHIETGQSIDLNFCV